MKVIIAFLFLVVSFVPNSRASASDTDYDMFHLISYDNIDVYDFPVVPGTPEWNEMEEQDRRKAIQVPDSVLSTMSTLGLAWTCLKYPDRHFWNFSSDGALPASIPSPEHKPLGFRWELLQRPDAGSAILKVYQALDPALLDPDWPRIKKMYFEWDFALLESMLSIPEILSGLSTEEKHRLLALCGDRYTTRLRQREGDVTIHLLMGRLFQSVEDSPFFHDVNTSTDILEFLDYPTAMTQSTKRGMSTLSGFIEKFIRGND
ncbi:MAG: hypothetical protein KJ970_14990 [Candidatus Eisenbacteria bacterium]|uniref:Uncharacterized protein n=1 Tax=Eiseniibacteriota bacterium TaxID=2212470 RepID=A0A948RXC6_UNCEI|nr:hypothetical protein [Candidatus Eisenbacteria bacterium]MBU1948333.1 hypothetical protein [Candidatus Eisenbacteria bacterium]MBU2692226.1 hypothetical protein [Candidatus Eisenbacteria bacterium]